MSTTHAQRRAAQHQALFDRFMKNARCGMFDAARGPDGKVTAGKWDLVCLPGEDEKDGQQTEFTRVTLSQMVDNFAERGDPIPLDFNHQSNYVHINGQPAPALAWYGALAVVMNGQVITSASCANVMADIAGIDLSRDGLWAYRSEVTELGDQLLPNFKLLSPTFTSDGTRRDGTPIGYCLAAVAATNTPWQGGTQITFEQAGSPGDTGAIGTVNKGERTMALSKYAKFAGAPDGADDSAIKQSIGAKMAGLAQKAMSDEDFDLASAAKEMDEAAALMEGDTEMAAECKMAKSMAAKFAKFAKAKFDAADGDGDGDKDKDKEQQMADDAEKAKFAADADKAKFATMEATINALSAKVATFESERTAKLAAERAENEKKFEQLANDAERGGYDKAQRANLIAFARVDYAAAYGLVKHLLPKTNAPSHLFDRATRNGAPIGGETNARTEAGPVKPRKVHAMGADFIETDGEFADEIKKVADSKEPHMMSKVDKLLHPTQRQVMFYRLRAAEKIVRAERPDLAAAAADNE